MSERFDVCVLGSLNVDFVASVARRLRRGETVTSLGLDIVPGGKGANQALAAARLGARTALIGRVGGDPYGTDLRNRLADEGVDVTYVRIDPEAPTGLAIIIVEPSGQNSIILAPGANARVGLADVEAAEPFIRTTKALVVQMEMPASVASRALHLARSIGVRTIFNQAPALPIDRSALECVDLLIVNETEAEVLTGVDVDGLAGARRAAAILRSTGPGAAIVTMGGSGAVVDGPDGQDFVPAFVVDVVDTTAAGDAFVAATTLAWLAGQNLAVAAGYGSQVAALTVGRRGAQPSLPTAEEVAAWRPPGGERSQFRPSF